MRAQIIADHKADILKAGFKAAGFKIIKDNTSIQPDDVLVAWNRKRDNVGMIENYECAGAKVIIAENGYIGRDFNGNKLIALAQNHHLGAGRWFVGEEMRYINHNFKIMPWRSGGKDIVILAQRGIGNAKRLNWYVDLAEKVKKITDRRVILRPHPGKKKIPLEPVLEKAFAVITYSSAAAIHALAFGVPAFHLMKDWIAKDMAVFGLDDLEKPFLGERNPVFHRIGWAQWTPKEIISGEAIKAVMSA